MLDWVWLIAGLALLVISGEALVKGAVGFALKFKVSTLVIGVTIVSAGTSAPELFVSIEAALKGHPEIAVGNVLGSNIANIALILGLTALIFPIRVQMASVRLDWPVMMLASVLLFLFTLNDYIGIMEGIFLFLMLIVYSFVLFYSSRKNNATEEASSEIGEAIKMQALWKALLFLLMGIGGLVLGSNLLLKGAIGVASGLGISERVIGLTVVAFGTSVPELVTSCVAAFRKQPDIALGNIIGSNIFNICMILGITAMIKEIPVPAAIFRTDMLVVIGVSFIIFPLMLLGYKLNRWKGLFLFSCYISYVLYLFWK